MITPCDGLVRPEATLRTRDLARYARVPVDVAEPRYRRPLLRHLEALAPDWAEAEVVLLGSVASPKYVEVLSGIFGERLLFPIEFVGRGDMSRGGLLLRQASAGVELEYVSVLGATLHGARPPKLPPLHAPTAHSHRR